jgi:hypothetical protein
MDLCSVYAGVIYRYTCALRRVVNNKIVVFNGGEQGTGEVARAAFSAA